MKKVIIVMLLLTLASCKKKEELIKGPTAKQKAKYEELTNEASQLYYEYLGGEKNQPAIKKH